MRETRKQYKKDWYTKNLLEAVHSDTGFNVICTSCAEFKSRYACVGINVLSEDQQNLYLIKSRKLESKDNKRYVCKSCKQNR